MITIEHDRDDCLVCRVAGKLTKSDYDAAIPELENILQIRADRLRLMIVLEDFRGWESAALWEDMKFDFKHRKDFQKIAVLGASAFEEWGTRISNLFYAAQVRFFDMEHRDKARQWILED